MNSVADGADGDGEGGALDHSGQKRGVDAEVGLGLLVHLEDDGAKILHDPGHARRLTGGHGHAAVGTDHDPLLAIAQHRAGATGRGDVCAGGYGEVGRAGLGVFARRGDPHAPGDFNKPPVGGGGGRPRAQKQRRPYESREGSLQTMHLLCLQARPRFSGDRSNLRPKRSGLTEP